MMFSERRDARVPVALYGDLVVDENVMPAFVTSLSEQGLLLDSLAVPGTRRNDVVQLQLTLPGEPDPLWICGRITRDDRGPVFNETAIRFEVMATGHWRSLRRWLRVRAMLLQAQPIGIDIDIDDDAAAA